MAPRSSKKHDRARYLGGSDIAGVLGLNPWATPLDIYYRKVGRPPELPQIEIDEQRERMLRRGKLMEPVVVDMLIAEYPIKVTKRSSDRKPNRHKHCLLPFMAAEVDFEWRVTQEMIDVVPELDGLPLGSIQNGEVKTVHPFGSGIYGEAGTDEIPIQYACQAMHGLGVTGRQHCLVPVLVGSDNLLLYHVRRDQALITEMEIRGKRFWREHVLAKVPPKPQDLGDGFNLLRQRKDVTVQADPEMLGLVSQLIEWGEAKSKAEAAQKEIQFHLVSKLVGEEAAQSGTMENKHRIMHAGKPILTVGLQGRDSIRMKELHAEHPDIYEEFVKHSTFFVCRPTRSK